MASHSFVKVLLLIFVAAALRFYGLDWDGGIGAHPDERYVVGVAESLRWPDRLNPFDVAPDFAYGHLPLYLLALTRKLAHGADPLLVGRTLAALFDLGTVVLTFALGRQIYGENIGLLAAAFVALMVLHVQQAHFYTADAPLAFFVLGSLLFAVRLAERGRALDAWLAGAWAGLALGTKFSAALLVLPLGAALLSVPAPAWKSRYWALRRGLECAPAPAWKSRYWALRRGLECDPAPDWKSRCWALRRGLECAPAPAWKSRYWALRRGLECGAAALATFALTNPFALFEFSTFWRNVGEQSSIVRGMLDVPYTRQFHGTWPYLYPIVQQLRWGMGWPLGLLAFGGLAYAVWRAVREPPRQAEWVLLAWVVPGFTFVGALYVKFPRYLLPLTPLLALYAASLLATLRQRSRRLASFFTWLSLICSLFHCLAIVSLYRFPHPWLLASEWFTDHAPQGAVVAVEQWDHPLPLDAAGYDVRELPLFDEDTGDDALEKWAEITKVMAEADYVIVASRRGYAALARWPERYPLTARYYRRLFDGELSFEPVACFGRYPRLGPLVLVDDPSAGLGFSLPKLCQPDAAFVLRLGRLDESYVVYEHPQVVIWQKRP